jgi:hypothetical protein
MALPILQNTDFVGKVKISTNSFSGLDNYISELEPNILLEVLNSDCLYEIETEDPIKAKYTDLLDGGYYINSDGDRVKFTGLKQFLKYYIYAAYNVDNFSNTVIGNVRNISENSNYSGAEASQIVYNRWNEAVTIYEEDIYLFLKEYEEIKTTVTASVDNSGTYALSVPSTKYLYAGDEVTIDDVEYTVFSIVNDTTINIIEATSGLDFTGKVVVWKPFFDIEYFKYDLAWL